METSAYLASLLGPIMVFVGIGLFINSSFYKKIGKEFAKEKGMLLFSAMLGMLWGLAIIYAHNIWAFSAEWVITLLGWIMLIKSALFLAFPEDLSKIVSKIKYTGKSIKIFWIIYLLIGIYLIGYSIL